MKRLSNIEAELKKALLIKEACISFLSPANSILFDIRDIFLRFYETILDCKSLSAKSTELIVMFYSKI